MSVLEIAVTGSSQGVSRRDLRRLGAIALGGLLTLAYLLLPACLDPAQALVGGLQVLADRYAYPAAGGGSFIQFVVTEFRLAMEPFTASYIRIGFWCLPALALLTWGLAGWIRSDQIGLLASRAVRHAPIVVVTAALAGAGAVHLISARVLEHHPITWGDEYSYAFQARLFAAGQLYADAPPVAPGAFRNRAFVCDQRWHGIGFGGHPLVLSLGCLLGSIRVVTAVLAGVNVMLAYLLTRELFDKSTGVLAAVLLAVSPLFLFYHATLLPESTTLATLLAFTLFSVRGIRRRSMAYLLAAGVILAFAIFTRPQTACVFALPVGLWVVARQSVAFREKLGPSLILVSGAVVGTVALLVYAHLVSGDPFGTHVSPGYHHDEIGGAAAIGIDSLVGFTKAAVDTLARFTVMNFVLLGWPLSLAGVWFWWRHRRSEAPSRLLAACALMVVGFYFLYPGKLEQYYVEAGAVMVILTAAGITGAYRAGNPSSGHGTQTVAGDAGSKLIAFILASFLLGAVTIWPMRSTYFHERTLHARSVFDTIEKAGLHGALVFLDGLDDGQMNCVGANSPTLEDDVLLVKGRSPAEMAAIARHFRNRSAYRLCWGVASEGLRLLPFEPGVRAAHQGGSAP